MNTRELRDYLDGLDITSININDIRDQLYMLGNSDWNDIVDGETAARENNKSSSICPPDDDKIKYTQDELIQLCAAIEKLNKMDKRFLVDYGYENAVEIANSLEMAAQCWCSPLTRDSEMDANLAKEFAKKIDEVKELHTQELKIILENSKKIEKIVEKLVKNYDELIYAVGRKFPNESRHQTALRYILNSEKEDITNYADTRKP